MIQIRKGDLFASQAQTLVNTVNTVGVMGKGIALEFRRRFPAMFNDYAQRCARGEVRLGRPYVYRDASGASILNFPTKEHWRSASRLDAIVNGLDYLEQHYREWGITSLAVPPLGCGHGQLEWRIVGPTLYQHLSRLEIPVELYPPFDVAEHELELGFLGTLFDQIASEEAPQSRIDPAWVALVEILARVEEERHHAPTGRVRFQKMAYFATESGIPTGLTYVPGSYGPFAEGIKRQVGRLANNGLVREDVVGRAINLSVGPTYGAARKAFSRELGAWEEPIGRVTDLFARLKSIRAAEVAASVHFVASRLAEQHGGPPDELDVLDGVLTWKQRRQPPFTDVEVSEAIRSLGMLGWLAMVPNDALPFDEDALLSA